MHQFGNAFYLTNVTSVQQEMDRFKNDAYWSDVLRAKTGVVARDFPNLKKETAELSGRFKTPEILKRIRRLEQMRDHLAYNIQEALAIEVAFLRVFGS